MSEGVRSIGLSGGGLGGIADGLGINASHALDHPAGNLGGLLGLYARYALGDLHSGFRSDCRNCGCDLSGEGGCCRSGCRSHLRR